MTGNLLVLDTGNALFRAVPGSRALPEDEARAKLILSTMGALGTKVLAVGHRDLAAGHAFLVDAAKQAGVALVSTNLELEGSPAFSRSLVLDVGGVKVAVLVASGNGQVAGAPEVVGTPSLPPLLAELKRLPPRDVTVLVCASGYAEAMALAEALSGSVDVVLQSGEFRGAVPPQRVKDVTLLASGQRGQSLARLELTLGPGRGPFRDLNEAARDQELLENLDRQLTSLDERLKLAADADGKKSLQALRKEMKARRDEQAQKVKTVTGGRTLKLDWVPLGADVKDDEAIKAEVLKIEPTYSGQH